MSSRPFRCNRHGKICFASEAAAEAELARQREDPNPSAGYLPIRYYQDPGCLFWHLTHQPLRKPPPGKETPSQQ